MAWGDPCRDSGGDEDLFQVNAGLAGFTKGRKRAFAIGRVHPAMGVDGKADRDIVRHRPDITEFGHHERIRAIAVVISVKPRSVAVDAGPATRNEDIDPAVDAVAQLCRRSRVGSDRKRILRQGDGNAPGAL